MDARVLNHHVFLGGFDYLDESPYLSIPYHGQWQVSSKEAWKRNSQSFLDSLFLQSEAPQTLYMCVGLKPINTLSMFLINPS